ncbi:hypothetical protein BS78_05G281300 [Paspalum vaginatum]|nr:hypothetical protein BS78_05G281300 [Paspalum vaginatum]
MRKRRRKCSRWIMHVGVSKWAAKQVTLLLLASSLSFLGIHGQLDSLGFISIDCGTSNSKYTEDKTGITYVSDEGFTDTGLIHPVNMENMQGDLALRYSTLRFFPSGTRNCYTLRSVTPGGKYYVRAVFGYGNYDKLNKLPIFDLYIGVNYWTTVSIVNSSTAYIFEIIAVSPANYLQVCLVSKGLGNPFISGLDLRSLNANLYPDSTATQSLVLLSFFRDTVGFGPNRYHFGTEYQHIRYPDDKYDRIWQKYEDVSTWTVLSDPISGIVNSPPNDTYAAPSAVMRSVSTQANASRMDLWWSSDSSMTIGENTQLLVMLYFAELESLQQNEFREFSVILDNTTLDSAFRPEKMLTTVLTGIVQGAGSHAISLVPTLNSKPPLISATEIYVIRQLNGSLTYAGDASAMLTIQIKYSMKRNWQGDPCMPIAFAWDSLNCTYNSSGPSRITAIYLSSNGLNGEIDPSFGQLTLLQHLDLSHNNLSGSIPDVLGQLTSLTFLDLSSNNLSGSIPTSLLQKFQSGSLTLRCRQSHLLYKKNKKKIIIIATAIPGAALVALLALTICYRRALRVALIKAIIWYKRPTRRKDVTTSTAHLQFQTFTYDELHTITNGFENQIGKGGFGPVYAGKLENGTRVAVKIRSQGSSQGDKEYSAEVKNLGMLRHNSLVVLLGHCKDEEHLGLVYEFVRGGNLEDRLIKGGPTGQEPPLTWSQRLTIAVETARGLHYLHSALRTPLIHRDVKATNILLIPGKNTDDAIHAKISDFGIAKAISSEAKTHTLTERLIGTPGYIDPQYLSSGGQVRGKTDVYSFGILLLVLITAKPASVPRDNNKDINIADLVRQRLFQGGGGGGGRSRSRSLSLSRRDENNIKSLLDPSILGHCDLSSAWKVADLALRCAQADDVGARPTMTEVVAELEALQRQEAAGTSSAPTVTCCGWLITVPEAEEEVENKD